MKKIKLITIILALVFCISFSFKYLYENTTPVFNVNNGVKLPIIMYHHIIEKQERLNKFAITPKQFENDLKYIKENGFETITTKNLIDYIYDDAPLPEKPIMITFDDGHESFYEYVYPLLKKYNMSAILSVVGNYTDTYSETEDHNVIYSYLTWKQINEMSNSPYVEIANHTYNLHSTDKGRKGCSKKAGESLEQYKKVLEDDILKLQEEILMYTGHKATTFTYPFGKFSKETKPILKEFGFSAILTCAEFVNTIDKNNPEFLYNLGRFNRPHGINTQDFFDKILNE